MRRPHLGAGSPCGRERRAKRASPCALRGQNLIPYICLHHVRIWTWARNRIGTLFLASLPLPVLMRYAEELVLRCNALAPSPIPEPLRISAPKAAGPKRRHQDALGAAWPPPGYHPSPPPPVRASWGILVPAMAIRRGGRRPSLTAPQLGGGTFAALD